MKSLFPGLFLALCITSCSQKNPDQPVRDAISAHLKATANDPASYEAVRFSAARPWRQQDENGLLAAGLRDSIAKLKPHAGMKFDQVKRAIALGMPEHRQWRREWMDEEAEMLALGRQARALEQKKDTARLGQCLVHAYRWKNSAGALMLDSARFVIINKKVAYSLPF